MTNPVGTGTFPENNHKQLLNFIDYFGKRVELFRKKVERPTVNTPNYE